MNTEETRIENVMKTTSKLFDGLYDIYYYYTRTEGRSHSEAIGLMNSWSESFTKMIDTQERNSNNEKQ